MPDETPTDILLVALIFISFIVVIVAWTVLLIHEGMFAKALGKASNEFEDL